MAWIRSLNVILESGTGFSNHVNVGPRYQDRHGQKRFLEVMSLKEEKKRVGREAFRLPRKVLTTLKGRWRPKRKRPGSRVVLRISASQAVGGPERSCLLEQLLRQKSLCLTILL